MRLVEQVGRPTRLGVVWLLGLTALSVTGLLGADVEGAPLLPRTLGVGLSVFLLCCWLAALVAALRARSR